MSLILPDFGQISLKRKKGHSTVSPALISLRPRPSLYLEMLFYPFAIEIDAISYTQKSQIRWFFRGKNEANLFRMSILAWSDPNYHRSDPTPHGVPCFPPNYHRKRTHLSPAGKKRLRKLFSRVVGRHQNFLVGYMRRGPSGIKVSLR